MSEQITAEQIDELKANGYKLTTGSRSRSPWWMLQTYGSNSQPNDCETFAAAARAAWEHYQASKRPAKPQYPSGWVEYDGYGYDVRNVLLVDGVWMVYTGGNLTAKPAPDVHPCPPRPEPPKGWKLTGRVVDINEIPTYWIGCGKTVEVFQSISHTNEKPCLRWETVRDVPQVYDATTLPKGHAEIRHRLWRDGMTAVVAGRSRLGIVIVGPRTKTVVGFSWEAIATECEISVNGGEWRPARPE